MKRFLCALLACSMCATAAVGFAGCGCTDNTDNKPGYVVPTTVPDLKSDDFGFFIINDNQLMITEYLGTNKDVVIPETFNNYTVTTIGSSVFNSKDITSVEMPDSITEIKDYAFSSNRNLKSVKLSKNLETLGTNVFFNCRSLESIELPTTLKDIGVYAFAAAGLKSVTIPESDTFTKLGEFMFYQCQELTEVTRPSTVKEIPDNAFSDCPNPITIKAPEGSYGIDYAKNNNFAYEEISE
ncbi:MAG TPA: hypothetical protein DEP65_09415 [Ruminococcus sp.]|nr:hypothetical protein [Ruminococcus sp.]